jgi:hypothetical protein
MVLSHIKYNYIIQGFQMKRLELQINHEKNIALVYCSALQIYLPELAVRPLLLAYSSYALYPQLVLFHDSLLCLPGSQWLENIDCSSMHMHNVFIFVKQVFQVFPNL